MHVLTMFRNDNNLMKLPVYSIVKGVLLLMWLLTVLSNLISFINKRENKPQHYK